MNNPSSSWRYGTAELATLPPRASANPRALLFTVLVLAARNYRLRRFRHEGRHGEGVSARDIIRRERDRRKRNPRERFEHNWPGRAER